MKKSIKVSAALVLAMTMATAGYAATKSTNYSYPQKPYTPPVQQQYSSNVPYSAPLKGQVTFVPAGTSVPAVTTMEISTANITPGQQITLALGDNFYYGNKMIAPAGSSISGYATVAKKAGRTGKNAQLMIRFQSITTLQGTVIPISAVMKTTDGTGLLKGGTAMDTTKDYAKDMAIGSGVGALSGLVVGAIAGGDHLGKTTAITTGIGAGVGLAKSLWDKGGEIVIPANSQIDIILQQPMTVNNY